MKLKLFTAVLVSAALLIGCAGVQRTARIATGQDIPERSSLENICEDYLLIASGQIDPSELSLAEKRVRFEWVEEASENIRLVNLYEESGAYRPWHRAIFFYIIPDYVALLSGDLDPDVITERGLLARDNNVQLAQEYLDIIEQHY